MRMKGIVYRSSTRSAMLYGRETWCLRESEMAILRRTETAMVRSMCGVKLVNRKKMEELMEMFGLKETLDRMAKANGVRWYGHVIRRDDDNILKKAMMLEVNEKQKQGQPKMTWEGGGRECEGSRVEDRGSCRSNKMEGRCESNHGGDEVYPATFGNEEIALKLDDDDGSRKYFLTSKMGKRRIYPKKKTHMLIRDLTIVLKMGYKENTAYCFF